jgi:hypothetical protein
MRKWKVTGASKSTGRDVTVEVDAMTAIEAQEQAAAMNLLVADVEPAVPTATLSYQTPAPAKSSEPSGKPGYRPPSRAQLVELTSKEHKRTMLIAAGMCVLGTVGIGVAIAISELANGVPAFVLGMTSGGLLLLGLVLFVVARIRAWWDNG